MRELFLACGLEGKPDVEKLKELIKRKDIDLNEDVEFDPNFTNAMDSILEFRFLTPFDIACRNGYLEIVEVLMRDERVKVNSSSATRVLPFHTACVEGHLEIVKYMLINGRILTDFTQLKNNSFIEGCMKRIDIGKWILASGRKIPKEIIEATKSSLEKRKNKSQDEEAVIDFIQLLDKFLLDSKKTRKELRKELGLPGLIFILMDSL